MITRALVQTTKINPSVSFTQNRQEKYELTKNRRHLKMVGKKFNINCQGMRNEFTPPRLSVPRKDLVEDLWFKSSFGKTSDLDSNSSFVTSSSLDFHYTDKAYSFSVKLHDVPGSSGECVTIRKRLTEKGTKVMVVAQTETRHMGHNFVGTEQILLALVSEETGLVAELFKSMGINIKEARAEVEKFIGRGDYYIVMEMPLTPGAKRVLELSLEKARELGHNYIGPEHLLFGLVCLPEGLPALVLENLGADLNKIRTQVFRMLGESTEALGTSVVGCSPGHKSSLTIDEYNINLTKLAEEGKLDPVAGRQQEIERVIDILGRSMKNNPCLYGEPGVGKTTIVEGLVQRIADGDVPETVKGKKVIRLDVDLLVAGTRHRNEIEERLKKVMEEIKQSAKIILFIDDLQTLIGTGASEGAIDAANILQSALVRGQFQCIGATTLDEYRKHIEMDLGLGRLFDPIRVSEPSIDESIQILKAIVERYELHHKLRYTDEALVAAVQLSHHYISDRFLPGKAIDLIDAAGYRVGLLCAEEPKELEKELGQVSKDKVKAFNHRDAIEIQSLKVRELHLREQIRYLVDKGYSEATADLGPFVTEADIKHIVSEWTGIPVEEISS